MKKTLILLGIQLSDEDAVKEMEQRCREAAKLYRGGIVQKIVACGGRVGDESVSEADAMKALLLPLGVGEDALFLETASKTTMENLMNAKPSISKETEALIVTSDYHAARVSLIARRIGMPASVHAVKTTLSLRKIKKLALEPLFMLDILLGNEDSGASRPRWTRVIMKMLRQEKE